METIAPTSTLDFFEDQCELHFSAGGFWQREPMHAFLKSLDDACMPLVKARKPIYVMGDFTAFVPQDRDTGEAIRNQLMTAVKFGLRRVAIVGASALVKLQYKRLSEGVEVDFFESKGPALAWLRANR